MEDRDGKDPMDELLEIVVPLLPQIIYSMNVFDWDKPCQGKGCDVMTAK